jgi:hypothetical protein
MKIEMTLTDAIRHSSKAWPALARLKMGEAVCVPAAWAEYPGKRPAIANWRLQDDDALTAHRHFPS